MDCILLDGNLLLTVFTKLWFFWAGVDVTIEGGGWELSLAVRARGGFMKLLFVIFLEVNVVHLSALGALFDVATAVAEMRRNF